METMAKLKRRSSQAGRDKTRANPLIFYFQKQFARRICPNGPPNVLNGQMLENATIRRGNPSCNIIAGNHASFLANQVFHMEEFYV